MADILPFPVRRWWATAAPLSLLVGGCTLGPDFVRPDPPTPAAWREAPAEPTDIAIAPQWWTMFADPALDALEVRAMRANIEVQRAIERIQAARVQQGITRVQAGPQLNGQAGYTRDRLGTAGIAEVARPLLGLPGAGSEGPSGIDFDQFSIGAGASWEIDLWGKQRRLREAAGAEVDAAQAVAAGVRLSVQAEIAHTYFQWRAIGTELDYARQSAALAEQGARIVHALEARGLASRTQVVDAEARVRAQAVACEDLANQRKDAARALAVLVEGTPDSALPALEGASSSPALGPVPSRIPSEMARRRPDILAAEAELHAATAAIGVAKADFYPSISLSGQFSLDALSLSDLGWDARNTSIGPMLSLPIFNGGRLARQLALRKSEQRSAALAYRATVIAAWQEVESALALVQSLDRRTADLAAIAEGRAAQANAAATRQVRGDTALQPVLDARALAVDAARALARHRTALLLARVQLVRALGG